MNLKTTFVLVLLTGAAAGGWGWWWHTRHSEEVVENPTLTFFNEKLTPDKLTRVEVSRVTPTSETPIIAANTIGLFASPLGFGAIHVAASLHPPAPQTLFVLEKTGAEWHLPGNWPARTQETDQWIAVVANLKTRFTPIKLADPPVLIPYGLNDRPLIITVTADKETHTLRLGQEPDDVNRFTRATYVQLDKQNEIIRLGPGVFTALNRSLDYFRQRRLFPIERVAKDEDSRDKVEQLAAREIEVVTDTAKFVIQKKDTDWILKDAFKKKDKDWLHVASTDRVDPAKRDALLRAFPDLWAEKFIQMKTLDDVGLKEPAYTITITRPNGGKAALLVGNVSRSSSSFKIIKQGPMPFPMEMKEEFRYAKLENNPQLFEIKTDKLGDITLAIDALRDPNLARFKSDDVKRLEIRHGAETLVFVKVKEDEKDPTNKKEKWRIEKPHQDDADAKQIEDILDKLAGLQARDEAVLDKADLKTVGLDAPAGHIKITVEEGKEEKKKTRQLTFALGLKDKEKDKVYVKVDDWPRVNEVASDIWTLAQRSDLVYRPRELWKFDRDAITRITIDANGKPYHLDRGDKAWKVAGPVEIETSGPEPDNLAEELAQLKVERFEARATKDLAKYGLDKPAFKISVVAKDQKPRTLEIGKRDDSKEGGRFARLEGGDAIFVVSEKLASSFKADPLDFLDKNLVNLVPAEIERIRYKGANPFALEKKKLDWMLVDSPATPFAVEKDVIDSILKPFEKLRAEKFAAVGPKPKINWADYGLENPEAIITITLAGGEPGKAKEHTLELGKEAKEGGRYARVDKKDAVVVLNDFIAESVNRSYLDFVDPRVLKPFDIGAVTLIERKKSGADVELAQRDDNWQLVKPALRDADNLTIFDLLRRTSGLTAKRIEAMAPKKLDVYGLDNPAAVVTFHLDSDGGKKHVVKVGNVTNNKAKNEKDERFAMVDDKQTVIVLSAELSRLLVAPVLAFADRNVAVFSNVDRAELTRGPRKLSFARIDSRWQIAAPVKADAEGNLLDDLIRGLQRLRADEIVAEKGADLKKYGLEKPFAEWRFKLGDEDQLHLLIGDAESKERDARRYAKLGNRNAVFLLSSKLTNRLLSEFRSKNAWTPFEAAKVDELTVTGPTGPFTLKLKDKEWSVAGQPNAVVKTKAITDTIDMLANLRVEQFIADAKADLKQYDLEKPVWKLEVKSGATKHELWISAKLDEAKRPFATVAGSGAIFTLDEVDNIVLARPLSAYVVEPEKKN